MRSGASSSPRIMRIGASVTNISGCCVSRALIKAFQGWTSSLGIGLISALGVTRLTAATLARLGLALVHDKNRQYNTEQCSNG